MPQGFKKRSKYLCIIGWLFAEAIERMDNLYASALTASAHNSFLRLNGLPMKFYFHNTEMLIKELHEVLQ